MMDEGKDSKGSSPSLKKKDLNVSTSSLASKKSINASTSSLGSLFKGGVDNFEDSVTKKWLSWMLKRHVQGRTGKATVEDSNQLVDNALEFAKDIIKTESLDPMRTQDDESVFEQKLLFIRLTAYVSFHNTELRGMASLKRKGDSSLSLEEDWLTLETELTTHKMEARSHCTAKFLDVGPTFDLTADIESVTVRVKIRINTAEMQIIITTLEVTDVGRIAVSESGNLCRMVDSRVTAQSEGAPVDCLTAAVAELFIARCRDSIVRLFEFEAMCQLEAALKRLDLGQMIKSYGKSYIRSAADAVKNSMPNIPLP